MLACRHARSVGWAIRVFTPVFRGLWAPAAMLTRANACPRRRHALRLTGISSALRPEARFNLKRFHSWRSVRAGADVASVRAEMKRDCRASHAQQCPVGLPLAGRIERFEK